MNTDENLNNLLRDYRDSCRRLERLKDSVCQESADAKAVYEQYRATLQNSKEVLDRYFHDLETLEKEDRSYQYRTIRDAMHHFEEELKTVEFSIQSIRSIPPFLY